MRVHVSALGLISLLSLGVVGQAAAEEPTVGQAEPGRPAPLKAEEPLARVPAQRHVDVGSSVVFVTPISNSIEDAPPKLQYEPGPGISAYVRIVLMKYLHVAAVFSWAPHVISHDHDALGLQGLDEVGSVTSYRLEAHAMPTLPLGDRVRLFGILGLGWGRLEIGSMYGTDENGRFLIRRRGASYFDVPAGLGTSIELLPHWMSLDFAIWAAPTFAKEGTAHLPIVAIDAGGEGQTVGPLPQMPILFVQSLGLSLLL